MQKIKLLALVLSMVFSGLAFADDTDSDNLSRPVSISLDQMAELTPIAAQEVFHNWTFVGCVENAHECDHHAHEHGFHHHTVTYDQNYCDHHHLACWGRN
jgi:hypothetical protein